MSKYIRGSKKSVHPVREQRQQPKSPERTVIHATVRSPMSPAAVGLASMMLMTTAAAQDAGTATQPGSGTAPPQQQTTTTPPPAAAPQSTTAPAAAPQQQSTTAPQRQQQSTTLPTIDVRAPRRVVRTRPAPAAPAAPAPAPIAASVPSAIDGTSYQSDAAEHQPPADAAARHAADGERRHPAGHPGAAHHQHGGCAAHRPRHHLPAGEGGKQGDTPIIRGFAARGDIFRDGIRDPGWYTRDLFNADRVEVYKGPSAFAFGRGSTGGAINIVTKLPTGASFVDGVITGTSPRAIASSSTPAARRTTCPDAIAALYQDVPTPDRDNVGTKRWGVAPSVQVDAHARTPRRSSATSIRARRAFRTTASLTCRRRPTARPIGALTNPGYNGNGTPTSPVPIPRSNWFGVLERPARRTSSKPNTHIATGKLEHKLAPATSKSPTRRATSPSSASHGPPLRAACCRPTTQLPSRPAIRSS